MNETAYEHIQGDTTFTITAAERWSIGMIRRLKEKYPDQVDIRYVNKDGSILAHLPFEWMRIVPKRQDTLTDEQRQARSERMRALQAKAGHGEIEPISEDNPRQVSEDTPALTEPENAILRRETKAVIGDPEDNPVEMGKDIPQHSDRSNTV